MQSVLEHGREPRHDKYENEGCRCQSHEDQKQGIDQRIANVFSHAIIELHLEAGILERLGQHAGLITSFEQLINVTGKGGDVLPDRFRYARPAPQVTPEAGKCIAKNIIDRRSRRDLDRFTEAHPGFDHHRKFVGEADMVFEVGALSPAEGAPLGAGGDRQRYRGQTAPLELAQRRAFVIGGELAADRAAGAGQCVIGKGRHR